MNEEYTSMLTGISMCGTPSYAYDGKTTSNLYRIDDGKKEENKNFKLLTDEENTLKLSDTITLYRIECIKAFKNSMGDVEVGEKGGYVEKEDNIRDNAWVGGNAKVYGSAVIAHQAYVGGEATVGDNAVVCDQAIVVENANVLNHATICGQSVVFGHAYIDRHATIIENAHIKDNTRVTDHASVGGNAYLQDKVIVEDYANITGTAQLKYNATVGSHALIKHTNDYIIFNNVGSRHDTLTAYRTKYNGVRISVGCFLGSIDEFKNMVLTTHENHEQIKNEYLLIIEVIKNHFEISI